MNYKIFDGSIIETFDWYGIECIYVNSIPDHLLKKFSNGFIGACPNQDIIYAHDFFRFLHLWRHGKWIEWRQSIAVDDHE